VRLLAAKPKQVGFAARLAAEDINKNSTQLAITKSGMDMVAHKECLSNEPRVKSFEKAKCRSLLENSPKFDVRFHAGISEIVTIFVLFGT